MEWLRRHADGNSVEPFAIDGTTCLPVRGIAFAMGLNAAWDRGPDPRGADAWAEIKAANQSNSAGPDGKA